MRSLSVLRVVVTASCVLSGVAAEVEKGEPAIQNLAAHEVIQRSLEDGTWALKTRGLLDDFGSCDGCQRILSTLKGLVKSGDKELIDLGKTLCTTATSYDSQFCSGVVDREGPVIADIVRKMEINSTASTQFCVTFLGVCKVPTPAAWSVPFGSKKNCDKKAPALSGKKPLKVIHYSDIHIDPLYEKGASTDCKMPTCCRPYTDDEKPGNNSHPAGPNGDHMCDTPISLEKSMYKAIKDMFPDQAFSIFTGDIVDHALFNTSQPYNQKEIDGAYGLMNDDFKLVYGTAGNHEANPANIFYPNSQGNKTQWVYDALHENWEHWIGDKAAENVKSIGAYSTKYPNGNLRVISLNTNMYYRYNFALYQKQIERDPNDQIAWLAKELDAAEKANENVYIIGHMPLGERDALTDQSNYLDQVVKRYSTTIRAMFFGHTHVDHFEISYSDYSKRDESHAMAISYICPSLTPTSGMPSFRVYDVDPDTFAVLDATTYMADMEDKDFQTKGPMWKKYYSAKEVYGSALSPPVTDSKAELTPAFWHKVTEAFEKNQTLFDSYMSRKSRGWKSPDEKKCDDKCKKDEICQLRAGRAQDNCFVPTPGVHFVKRDMGHAHGEHDECGAPVIRDLLHTLAARQDMLELLQTRALANGVVIEPIKKRETPVSSTLVARKEEQDECEASNDGGKGGDNGSDKNSGANALNVNFLPIAALGAFLL